MTVSALLAATPPKVAAEIVATDKARMLIFFMIFPDEFQSRYLLTVAN